MCCSWEETSSGRKVGRRRRKEGKRSAACQLFLYILPPDICLGQHVFSYASFRMDQLIWKLWPYRRRMDVSLGPDMHWMGDCCTLRMDPFSPIVFPWSRVPLGILFCIMSRKSWNSRIGVVEYLLSLRLAEGIALSFVQISCVWAMSFIALVLL